MPHLRQTPRKEEHCKEHALSNLHTCPDRSGDLSSALRSPENKNTKEELLPRASEWNEIHEEEERRFSER